jgi:hypothetical protein
MEVLVLNESDSRYDSATCFQKTLRRERSLSSRFFSLDVNSAAYEKVNDDVEILGSFMLLALGEEVKIVRIGQEHHIPATITFFSV